MKVAILGQFGAATDSVPGGPQRVSRALSAALLQQGIDADLYELTVPRPRVQRLVRRAETECRIGGLPAIRVVTPLQAVADLRRDYDLVHFLGTLGIYTVPALWSLRRRRVPTLATLNGLFGIERDLGYRHSRADTWGERVGLGLVAGTVAVSERFRSLIEQHYPTVGTRTAVVEHGGDMAPRADAADTGPKTGENAAEKGARPHYEFVSVASERAEILTFAGTQSVKGAPFFLAAVQRLIAQHPNATATVVGVRGDAHEAVLHAIQALTPHARYAGQVTPDGVAALYERCTVYVQPSSYETFGLPVLEAMAHGKPVIVTSACGSASLIADGVTGFIVEHGDVASLTDRLSRLLVNEDLRRSMGQAARVAAAPWTWQRAASRYAEIYRFLASECTRAWPSQGRVSLRGVAAVAGGTPFGDVQRA